MVKLAFLKPLFKFATTQQDAATIYEIYEDYTNGQGQVRCYTNFCAIFERGGRVETKFCHFQNEIMLAFAISERRCLLIESEVVKQSTERKGEE